MITWRDVIDILAVAFIIYKIYDLIKGTRAVQVLKGLAILVVVTFLAQILRLYTLSWLLKNIWAIWVIAVMILFQPELRRTLARIGESKLLGLGVRGYSIPIEEIIKACQKLAQDKIGALIILRREADLTPIILSGTKIEAPVKAELIYSIFLPASPLHDGAVVIEGDEITAAACVLPLSDREDIPSDLGTRHRAAIGVSEESDAVAVVISEETGKISIAVSGTLKYGIDINTLNKMLKNLFPESPK